MNAPAVVLSWQECWCKVTTFPWRDFNSKMFLWWFSERNRHLFLLGINFYSRIAKLEVETSCGQKTSQVKQDQWHNIIKTQKPNGLNSSNSS